MSDPHLHATRLMLRPQLHRRETPAAVLAREDRRTGRGGGLPTDLVEGEESNREADVEEARDPDQERGPEGERGPEDDEHPAQDDRSDTENRGKAPQIAPRIGAARPVHRPPMKEALLKVEGGRRRVPSHFDFHDNAFAGMMKRTMPTTTVISR